MAAEHPFMRWILVAILAASIGPLARAEDDSRRDQVTAAAGNALLALQEEVGRTVIGGTTTVREVLVRTGTSDVMLRALQQAQQIGGPRWIDEQTCQVRLEISGSKVAAALEQIVAEHSGSSPISEQWLTRQLRGWDRRVFGATGTSILPGAMQHIRPQLQRGAWARVEDESRKRAVAAAREEAIRRVLESVGPIRLNGTTVAAELRGAALDSVRDWLASRPVQRVEFRDDLQVEVLLSARPGEFFEALRAALERQGGAGLPKDDTEWRRIQTEVRARMALPVGRAGVAAGGIQAARAVVPRPAPPWVDKQIDAEGIAPRSESKLRSARTAEHDALERLCEQIMALQLEPGLTIRQAAQQDARIGKAVRGAVGRARVYKVDYNRPDGTVQVKVSLDLGEVWEQIRSLP